MRYIRMAQGKFWAWVVVSLLVGLGLGLGIMLWNSAANTSRVAALEARLSGAGSDASAAVAAAEASVTALSAQNAQLASDLSAAQSQLDAASTGSTTSTATIAVASRNVSPSTVATGGALTLTVTATGHPGSVTMRVYTTSRSFDKTYTLKRVSTSGDTETWRLAIKAPTRSGTYHYFATAILGTTRVTMPGASPKSFTVK